MQMWCPKNPPAPSGRRRSVLGTMRDDTATWAHAPSEWGREGGRPRWTMGRSRQIWDETSIWIMKRPSLHSPAASWSRHPSPAPPSSLVTVTAPPPPLLLPLTYSTSQRCSHSASSLFLYLVLFTAVVPPTRSLVDPTLLLVKKKKKTHNTLTKFLFRVPK